MINRGFFQAIVRLANPMVLFWVMVGVRSMWPKQVGHLCFRDTGRFVKCPFRYGSGNW